MKYLVLLALSSQVDEAIPLPRGWSQQKAPNGRTFFIGKKKKLFFSQLFFTTFFFYSG